MTAPDHFLDRDGLGRIGIDDVIHRCGRDHGIDLAVIGDDRVGRFEPVLQQAAGSAGDDPARLRPANSRDRDRDTSGTWKTRRSRGPWRPASLPIATSAIRSRRCRLYSAAISTSSSSPKSSIFKPNSPSILACSERLGDGGSDRHARWNRSAALLRSSRTGSRTSGAKRSTLRFVVLEPSSAGRRRGTGC